MCGIAGVMYCRDRNLSALVRRLVESIRYRGPDDADAWCDVSAGVGLGHARLSVLDLSPAGHQPMASASGRYVIVFNGEIYNHLELRQDLREMSWCGHSDTETVLACIEAVGVEKTLPRLTGMFAFALWDRLEQSLTLVRDRIGEKPLYYGWCDGVFLFGSELKALQAYAGWRGVIDRGALASFMRYGYVPLPHSIYVGIHKLIPGTSVVLSSADQAGFWPNPKPYWSALDITRQPELAFSSDEDAISQLDARLRRAIQGQMLADVPLGAFLSGGIDSSTVVALMQAQSSRPIKTFSIGFGEGDYNEAVYAKAVAAHLGTDHTELYVTPADALSVIPRLPLMYDEPFGDSSGIPTHLVARLARQQVTVALSGDGGDELFGGYNRYFWGRSIWRRIGPLPIGLRRVIGRAVILLSPERWDQLVGIIRAVLPRNLQMFAFGDKLHKLARVIDVGSPDELYRRLVSQYHDPGSLVVGAGEKNIWADAQVLTLRRQDFSERMMFHDLVGYLTDDILTKVDRAAMAVSLETRVPMLDHHVVEFAWQLPLSMKIRNEGEGKWLLRRVLGRYVPRELIDRPKMGFGIPLDSWLRGPLRDWAESLLDARRLEQEGYFHPGPIRQRWMEHLSGTRNWQYALWNVLMFQAWNER